MRVVYLDHRFPHHGTHSGYQRLARFIEGEYIVQPGVMHRCMELVPDDWLFRFRPFHPNWYSREAFDIEVQAALQMISRGDVVFHFLYGEHSFRWSGKISRWTAKRNRVVATYHQLPEFFQQRRAQFRHVLDLDAIILVGTNQRDFFLGSAALKSVHVIPHGVDTQFFQPSSKLQNEGYPLMCLTVGSNYRDFELHVQVIRNINRSSLRGVQFVVIGEPICADYFKGLENVRYLSGITDDELLRYYQAAGLLLLPLADATACNALLEGMACGLPILVTDVGGVRDYVGEECAALVPARDPDLMTERLLALLEDKKQRTELGKQARSKAEVLFDWVRIADQVQEVYARVW